MLAKTMKRTCKYLFIIIVLFCGCSHRIEIIGVGYVMKATDKVYIGDLQFISKWLELQKANWTSRNQYDTYVPDNVLISVVADSGLKLYICKRQNYYILHDGYTAPITPAQFDEFSTMLSGK
jgi:hypothetical protein